MGIFFLATANPVPPLRAPAFPPLPHRLRDLRRVPPAAVEGVERRGAPVAAGRGEGVTAPALALPPRPGLRGQTACFQKPWLQQNRCHGRTHWAPAPEALSLRPPRVKARHAVPPQIASRLRSRRLVREPPALRAPALRTDLDPVRPAGPQGKQRLRRAPRRDAHRTRRLSSGRRR